MQEATLDKDAPGHWDLLHRISADVEAEMMALSLIHWEKDNFFCQVCCKHMNMYISTYPPEACIGRRITVMGVSIPKLFEWTVSIHNNVNRNKGKRIVTLEEAYERYRKRGPDEPCTLSCLNAAGPTVEEKKPKLRIVRK